jgi:adenylate kinase
MNLSIVGTKGAGKGTQVGRLARVFNLVSFSTGDAFRHGMKLRTQLGLVADKYVQRGELVPDDIVNGLVEEWIWTTTPSKGIIFDGFPRTTFQAAFLDETFREMGRKFDAVIYLDVSDEVVTERLSGRRVCNLCRDEFHTVYAPFKSCPKQKCAGQWLRHLDEDHPAAITALVKVFQRGIEPLLQHYEQSGRLITANGDKSIEEVHAALVSAVTPYR